MPIDVQRVQSIFQAVAPMTPAERAAVLERECGDDAELRHKVEGLLKAHDDSGELPAAEPERTRAYVPAVEPGQVFAGRYKLREQLAEGGMGVVFVADQTEPVQRRVALKIIRTGQDTQRLLARFEQERQALALMDHPNIAKVFDAGVDEALRPYFAMELVKGLPLTKYCDDAKLSPRERLELFIPVCQAVQHAHQKGIIHRDLKPSNILVGLYDGRPVPKVIDFGVAKATGPRLTEQSIYTEVGSIIGTLEYMSPEQAELNNLDIDTRSDIYALGVILYELLTGAVPFSRKELEKAGLAEMLRVIKEAEPPKPSTRLSQSGTLPGIAAARQTEPKRLTALVRGELDWIVMKALEKDRGRRYETANGFAIDVQRYLAGEPVLAAPASQWYRLRKFVRRHRPQMIAAGLALSALLLGLAVASWQAVRATFAERRLVKAGNEKQLALDAERAARKRTSEALDEMTSAIMKEWLARQPSLSKEQRAFLERTEKFYQEFLTDQGNDEDSRTRIAFAHLRLADILAALGRKPESIREAERAYDVFSDLASHEQSNFAIRKGAIQALDSQAKSMINWNKPEKIDPIQTRAVRLAEDLAAERPEDTDAISLLSAVLISRGYFLVTAYRYSEALAALDRALPLVEKLIALRIDEIFHLERLGILHQDRAICLGPLHRNSELQHEIQAAMDTYEEVLRRSPSRHSARHSLGVMHMNQAGQFKSQGRLLQAIIEYRKSEESLKRLAEEFPNLPDYQSLLASLYVGWARALLAMRNPNEATEMAGRAHKTWIELDYKLPAASALAVLAECRTAVGQFAEAERDFATAIRAMTDAIAVQGHNQYSRADLVNAYVGQSRALSGLGRNRDSLEAVERALAVGIDEMRPKLRALRATKLVEAGELAEAITEVAELAKTNDWHPAIWYDFACVYSVASGKFAEKKQEYADQALELLHKAVQVGYKDAAHMKKDTDLDPLRQREDFRKLIAELEGMGK